MHTQCVSYVLDLLCMAAAREAHMTRFSKQRMIAARLIFIFSFQQHKCNILRHNVNTMVHQAFTLNVNSKYII